jgi:hypothetical protein
MKFIKIIFLTLLALSFGYYAAQATVAGLNTYLSDFQRIDLSQKYEEISRKIKNRPMTVKPNLQQEYINQRRLG